VCAIVVGGSEKREERYAGAGAEVERARKIYMYNNVQMSRVQLRPPREFLVATTHMTFGDEIIVDSLTQPLENNLRSLDDT